MRAKVAADEVAVLRFGVDNVRFLRIDLRVEAIAALHGEPFGVRDAGKIERRAGSTPGVVVLQSAANLVGLRVVESDFVELTDGDLRALIPTAALVTREVESTVAADDHVVGVCGVDPHGVEVDVDLASAVDAEGLAAVF